MNVEQISRIDTNHARNAVNDAMYVIDKVIKREININDEYTLSIIEKNIDVAYHISLILARLNIINTYTVSEIKAAVESNVPFSEKDHHEDLANGDEVKRSNKIQKKRTGKYEIYAWVTSNLSRKKGSFLTWEVAHNGRRWIAHIPRKYYENKSSLAISCDPVTGEPSPRSPLYQYFKEKTNGTQGTFSS